MKPKKRVKKNERVMLDKPNPENLDIEKEMKRRTLTMLLTCILLLCWASLKVWVNGIEYPLSIFIEMWPFFRWLFYVMAYAVVMVIIEHLNSRIDNKAFRTAAHILNFPMILFQFAILFPYKKIVEPFLKPIIIISLIFFICFYIPFGLTTILFHDKLSELIPLILYLGFTISTIIITTSLNKIHEAFTTRYSKFEKENSEEERVNNTIRYSYGFSNKERILLISMKFFDQNRLTFFVYCFYFILIVVSALFKFGSFTDKIPFLNTIIEVVLASFASFIAFERILKNKKLISKDQELR